ncbi:MAG: hypothetical protein KatS3mg096_504 [Candidatus Parcubacteria bacterium]|nr:MAG: hypothetical protein KatS3mg096_504 [Candidatus Parcubacteria bacterium]
MVKNDSGFKFGVEHEIALINNKGKFLDYRNLSFDVLNKVVQKFPIYQDDYKYLRIGDLGIKVKRVYVEGLEIFDENGYLIKQYPKGLELRTKPNSNIDELFNDFLNDFNFISKCLKQFKIKPTFLSFNPYLDRVGIKIKLHSYEKKLRKEDPGRKTAPFALLTFGPDLNISFPELNDKDILDIVLKLNYYAPFIVPFTFSSPFYKGKLWDGYSVRIYFRSKLRPSAVGFVSDNNLISRYSDKWILGKNRIDAERGRVEFKAIDTIWDIKIYKGLLVLLKGLILENNLKGRAEWSDEKLMELSAKYGFDDNLIYDGAYEVLSTCYKIIKNNEERKYLKYLFEVLKKKWNFSKILISDFKKFGSINKVLIKYDKFKI